MRNHKNISVTDFPEHELLNKRNHKNILVSIKSSNNYESFPLNTFSMLLATIVFVCYFFQLYKYILLLLTTYKSHFLQKDYITRSGVRTHADIRPLDLKSNALTTRPSWCSCSEPPLDAANVVSCDILKYFNLQKTRYSLSFLCFHMFMFILENQLLLFNVIIPRSKMFMKLG